MTNKRGSCKTAAARLLSMRGYSAEGLRRKLRDKEYEDGEVDAVIDYCLELGYLDDEKFAAGVIRRYAERGKDRYHIYQQLRKRGIDGDTARAALDEWEEEQV